MGRLHCDAEQPCIQLQAVATKSRRADRVPLHAELVVQLKDWMRCCTQARGDEALQPGTVAPPKPRLQVCHTYGVGAGAILPTWGVRDSSESPHAKPQVAAPLLARRGARCRAGIIPVTRLPVRQSFSHPIGRRVPASPMPANSEGLIARSLITLRLMCFDEGITRDQTVLLPTPLGRESRVSFSPYRICFVRGISAARRRPSRRERHIRRSRTHSICSRGVTADPLWPRSRRA